MSVSGRHYAVAEVDVFPRPVWQPRPPILIAASGERLLSLAAREADIVAVAGRPDESEEASTCRRHAPQTQRAKMTGYRTWFHDRRRPPRA